MAEDYAGHLWAALREVRTGMLGLANAREAHSQPMTAHFEDDSGTLSFYAPANGALTQAARGSHDAVFHYAGPGHHLYACLHGSLSVEGDAAAKRRYWSDVVERWFPGGLESQNIVRLRLAAHRAQVWLNDPEPRNVIFARPVDQRGKLEF